MDYKLSLLYRGIFYMAKNTGSLFEKEVLYLINKLVHSNKFLLSEPYVYVHRGAKYFSKDRRAYIKCDISVEKYLEDPLEAKELNPAIIVVIECKDCSRDISIDDVEEFHEKLQQIGADNTKGIMITKKCNFQKSALNYAQSKGISLATLLPDDQIYYIRPKRNTEHKPRVIRGITETKPNRFGRVYIIKEKEENISRLKKLGYDVQIAKVKKKFFSSSGESSLDEIIINSLKI